MAKEKQPRPLVLSEKLKYDEKFDLYTVQLAHRRRFPWWILLLLLPLLLLIQCHKDISVTCLEPEGNIPVVEQPVTLEYNAHFLWSGGRFLATDSISLTQLTDSTGTTVFRDLPCSVFSYIFYAFSQGSLTAKSDCHAAADVHFNFHYTRHVDLMMEPRKEDLFVKLLDLDTGDPLPGGTLVYTHVEDGSEVTDSAKADEQGVVTIPQQRICSVLKLLEGKCYGYADTTRADTPAQLYLAPDDSAALRLRPIKERFTFFVKNKLTKEPIPGALCRVTLTHPNGTKISHPDVTTSTDGKGIAFSDAAFILATVEIHATKSHFKPGDLEGGPWMVGKFRVQPDDVRTIWLEPDPYTVEFQNVDSISGKPIAGAKNVITVKHSDGKTDTYNETSNSNGVFPVQAVEDDVVTVDATAQGYKPKHQDFGKFKDIKDRKVRMVPDMVTINFRTVNEADGSPLPGCSIKARGSISGGSVVVSPNPTASDGTFSVTFRRDERLTLIPSKAGWKEVMPRKVNGATYAQLQNSPQSSRDIPLSEPKLPPCQGGSQNAGNNHQQSYDMGQPSGICRIEYDFYSIPDEITVYDGVGTGGPVLFGPMFIQDSQYNGGLIVTKPFTQGAVTVTIKGTSNWKYKVLCP